jgi:hypothetical protein
MFLTRVLSARCLLALLRDVSGGRIRMTRIRLIVGLIIPHRTYLTITKTCKERPRPGPGCGFTGGGDDYIRVRAITLWEMDSCVTTIYQRLRCYDYERQTKKEEVVLAYVDVHGVLIEATPRSQRTGLQLRFELNTCRTQVRHVRFRLHKMGVCKEICCCYRLWTRPVWDTALYLHWTEHCYEARVWWWV